VIIDTDVKKTTITTSGMLSTITITASTKITKERREAMMTTKYRY